MSIASGGSDTLQRYRNNIPDLLRAMPVKISVKDGEPNLSYDSETPQTTPNGKISASA